VIQERKQFSAKFYVMSESSKPMKTIKESALEEGDCVCTDRLEAGDAEHTAAVDWNPGQKILEQVFLSLILQA
jgi:hypothetical protein